MEFRRNPRRKRKDSYLRRPRGDNLYRQLIHRYRSGQRYDRYGNDRSRDLHGFVPRRFHRNDRDNHLLSVIERVKEIGFIRSLGGRKKDVSRLFNAETFIIGGISCLIGIGVTWLLTALANLIVNNLSGISAIARLSPSVALIMLLLSVGTHYDRGNYSRKARGKERPRGSAAQRIKKEVSENERN